MLRPIAQTGRDPVYSMGDDAPIAPLAGRARPLASYFRQRFAQVTNPAIDHYRERTVMSVATLARAALAARVRGPAAGADRAARRSCSPRPGWRMLGAGSRSTRPSPRRKASGPAVERVADAVPRSFARALARVCLSTPRPVVTGRRSRRCSRSAAHDRSRRAGSADLVRSADRERRAARHAHGRDASRLRCRCDLPAARARDRCAPLDDRQDRW